MKLRSCLAMLLIGCAPEVSTPPRNATPEYATKLNRTPRPMKARAPESVAIYRTKAPEAPYTEVSELVDTAHSETDALDKLKLSAAGVGCDGLVVGPVRTESQWVSVGSNGTGTMGGGKLSISGTCIMFVQDPGTWRPSQIDALCSAERDKLFAAKDPESRASIARSMPPECHAATADPEP